MRRPSWRQRPTFKGRFTLALGLFAIVGSAVGGCGGTAPSPASASVLSPSTSTPVATTSKPTASAAATVPPEWTMVDAGLGAGYPGVVGFVGSQFVVFGISGKTWGSTDGYAWRPLPNLPGAGPDSYVTDVIHTEAGYVAVGRGNAVPETSAVWLSGDGHTWSRVPDSPVLAGDVMASVASGASGLVAIGSRETGSAMSPNGVRLLATSGFGAGVVWTSRDGTTWKRLADERDFHTFMRAVGWAPFGYVIAGGNSCSTLCQVNGPPLWLSADGISWRTNDPRTVNPVGPGLAFGVTRLGNEVVVVGMGEHDLGSEAVAWVSSDGERWSSHLIGPAGTGAAAVTNVGSRGVIAVGSAGIWGSPDGMSWTSLSHFDPYGSGSLGSVACGPDRCVATGFSGVWVGPATTGQ